MATEDFLSKPAVKIAAACILPNIGGWAGIVTFKVVYK